MSELKTALTPEQRLDMIYPLINQVPIYGDEAMALVSMINSIILGEDIVEGK